MQIYLSVFYCFPWLSIWLLYFPSAPHKIRKITKFTQSQNHMSLVCKFLMNNRICLILTQIHKFPHLTNFRFLNEHFPYSSEYFWISQNNSVFSQYIWVYFEISHAYKCALMPSYRHGEHKNWITRRFGGYINFFHWIMQILYVGQYVSFYHCSDDLSFNFMRILLCIQTCNFHFIVIF